MPLLKEFSLQSSPIKYVDVTVAQSATTGTATVDSGDKILSVYPISNQDQFIDSIAISGVTLTITLASAGTAANVFRVILV